MRIEKDESGILKKTRLEYVRFVPLVEGMDRGD